MQYAIAAIIIFLVLYRAWINMRPQGEVRGRLDKLGEADARAVLGVSKQADAAEIKAAHARLISICHPDKGGTDYLAAKINQAREVLLHDQ